ncbi:MAG: hypothetical protein J5509_03445 [Lachnospiraceae bacterium]|nr:hypothetical protein [Lachnospiraceae bacterium]
MKSAIITIAGISSRFNEGVAESEARHKIIYYESDPTDSLLYHLLIKCGSYDRVILVGGSRYEAVEEYCSQLPADLRNRISLVYNDHYSDLASGYSLYLGLKHLFDENPVNDIDEVLFVEGDLDIDRASFNRVVESDGDVLTYSHEPIYSNKAVVLYRDGEGRYRYAFNSEHGLLHIEEPFSVILNSGQMWKFKTSDKLKAANEKFYSEDKGGTNLKIIQNYIDLCDNDAFELIGLDRWTNCNTREDYHKILSYWEEEDI